MIAGTLEVQMLANIARLQKDMAEVKRTINSTMSDVERAVGKAKSVLGALGIGLGVGYFVSLIKGTIDAADHLRDLGKSTDIPVEKLAGLSLLAKQTGTDLDGLAKGINKMSVEMGKSPEKFRALGVTAKDNVEAFKQLSDIFNQLPDIQQRNALAQAVFSKSWAELAPAMSEGGKRIGEIIEKGARLSGITKEMTDRADELNDKWAELGGSGGILNRLVGPMLPLLIGLTDEMLKAREKSDQLTTSFSPLAEALRALIVFGGNVSFVFKGLGTEIGGLAAQVVAAVPMLTASPLLLMFSKEKREEVSASFRQFKAIRKEMVTDAEANRKAFDEWENRMMTAGKGPAAAPGAPAPGVDPAVAAATAARAAAFLNEEASKKAIADREKEAAAYKQVINAIGDKTAAMQAELVGSEKLTDGQQAALKIMGDLRDGTLKLTEAHRIQLGIDIERMLAVDQELKQKAQLIEANKAHLQSAQQIVEEQERHDEVLRGIHTSQSQSQQDHERQTALLKLEAQYTRTLGLSMEQATQRQREYNTARELMVEMNRINNDQRAEEARLNPEMEGHQERMIELQKRFNDLREQRTSEITEQNALRSQVELARRVEDQWRGVWDSVDSFAQQAWHSIGTKGEDIFKRLTNTLKTTLLDLLYQMTVRKWVFQIFANVTGQGNPAGGGVGSAISQLGGGGFNLNGISNSFGGGASLFGTSAAYQTALGVGAEQAGMLAAQTGVFGLEGLGATAGSAGLSGTAGALGAFGAVAPYAGAIASLVQGNVKGAAIQAGLTAVGTAIMPGIGTVIGAVLGAVLSGMMGGGAGPASFTGGRLTGTAGEGGFSGMYFGTSANSKQSFEWQYPAHLEGALPEINANINAAFSDMRRLAKVMGIEAADLSKVTASFNIAPAGEGAVAVLASFKQNLVTLTDQIALELVPNLQAMQESGETLTQTFVRLADVMQKAGLERAFGLMTVVVGIVDELDKLKLSALSPLMPAERLAKAQEDYARNLAGAEMGDPMALGALAESAKTYLEEARSYFASSESYTRIFDEVQKAGLDLMTTTLEEQSHQFTKMGLSLEQIAQYTAQLPNMDRRIADALAPVLASLRVTGEADRAVQMAQVTASAAAQAALAAANTPAAAPAQTQTQLDAIEWFQNNTNADAAGNPYVPFDGYNSNLHEGEIIIDPTLSSSLRRYGINVHGGGSGITKEDIDRLCAAVERGNEILMATRSDIKVQTKEITSTTRESAREMGNVMAGASEVRARA